MPDPNEIRRDPQTGARAQWDGAQWVHLGNPNPNPGGSGRTNADDLEMFKDFLTAGGSMLPMLLSPEVGIPLRVATAALGGATGRGIGHGMEAADGINQPSSLGGDLLTGAEAGASGEVLPPAVAGLLRYGGKAASAMGAMLPKSDYIRSTIGGLLGSSSLQSHAAGAAAGYMSKPVLENGGAAAERWGTSLGNKTTSQRLQDVWQSLTREPEPGPPTTHADINAAAREKVTQKKAAQGAYDNAGYTTPEGGPNLDVPFNSHAHVPAETSWPGMGPDATRAASPSPDSVMFAQPGMEHTYDGPVGKLTGRKAPTLNDTLDEALRSLQEQPAAARVGEGTPDPGWGPGGVRASSGSKYEPAPASATPGSADNIAARQLEMEKASLGPAAALRDSLGTPDETDLAGAVGRRSATGRWDAVDALETIDPKSKSSPPWWLR